MVEVFTKGILLFPKMGYKTFRLRDLVFINLPIDSLLATWNGGWLFLMGSMWVYPHLPYKSTVHAGKYTIFHGSVMGLIFRWTWLLLAAPKREQFAWKTRAWGFGDDPKNNIQATWNPKTTTGWWQLKDFWIFTPNFLGNDPILTSIFFRWVEKLKSTN